MGWGLTVTGLDALLGVFDELRAQWNGDVLYLVGPTVRYAVFQERGTSDIEARPFMRPAASLVEASPQSMVSRYAQGGVSSEEELVEALAIAVQNEAKKIANRKGVRDTGALISSITYERVQ